MDVYLTHEQGAFFPEVEDFLDWVDLQTTETLRALNDFIPPLLSHIESYALLMPAPLWRRWSQVRLRLLCP
jgi:hypothetical protein